MHLHRQGYCAAAISVRLKVPIEIVRNVVAKAAVWKALDDLRPENARRAQVAKVQSKRAKALALIAEAEAELSP